MAERRESNGIRQVIGPSGSGKTRRSSSEVCASFQRTEVVSSILRGGPPTRTTPFDFVEVGPAHPINFATTDSIPAPRVSVASYLGVDTILNGYFRRSKRRECPQCRCFFDRVTSARDALSSLGHASFTSIDILIKTRTRYAAEKVALLGFSRNNSNGEFIIDEHLNCIADEQRLRNALEVCFSIAESTTICRDSSLSKKLHFSADGVCPHCGLAEPRWSKKFVDFDISLSLDPTIPPLHTTRSHKILSEAERSWFARLPIAGVALEKLVEGPLSGLPITEDFQSIALITKQFLINRLPLLQLCSTLATSEWTKLIVAKCVLSDVESDRLVIDGASLALDGLQISRIAEGIAAAATSRSIVVIDEDPNFAETSYPDLDHHAESCCMATTILSAPNELPVGASEVVVVCGPPACGKTRWIRSRLANKDRPVAFVARSSAHPHASNALVHEFLKLDDSLTALFAASVEARTLGLQARHFKRTSRTAAENFCRQCSGSGFQPRNPNDGPSPLVECGSCRGTRVFGSVASVKYRLLNFTEFMNLTLAKICELLKGVSSFSRLVRPIHDLDLQSLPMGLPLQACSEGERYRLHLLRAVLESRTSCTFHLEHPSWRLSDYQVEGLTRFIRNACKSGHAFVVEQQDGRIFGDRVITFGVAGH